MMSTSDEEPELGSVVYKRGDLNEEDAEEIWNDDLLIKAYDRAVKIAYDAVKDSAGKGKLQQKKKSANESKAVDRRKPDQVAKPKEEAETSWQVNDPCLAYYADEHESDLFPGFIVSINEAEGTAVIHYDGYSADEEELHYLTDLQRLPESDDNGKKNNRRKESNSSHGDKRETDGENKNCQSSASASCPSNQFATFDDLRKAVDKIPFAGRPSFNNSIPKLCSPPPPSWLNGGNSSTARHHDKAGCKIPSMDEAISNSLMSWYMSGYHTGYYQALKDMEKASNSAT